MKTEIAVAELEPVGRAESRHGVERVPRLAGAAPAALLVGDSCERVEHAVEIRRDAQAEELEVVADVDDRRDALGAERLDEGAYELRAAEAAAQRDDAHALTSMALRVLGPTYGATRTRSSRVSTSSRKPRRSRRCRPKRSALPGP